MKGLNILGKSALLLSLAASIAMGAVEKKRISQVINLKLKVKNHKVSLYKNKHEKSSIISIGHLSFTILYYR